MKGALGKLKEDIAESPDKSGLKVLIKSLGNKSLTPGILGAFSPTKVEKNHNYLLDLQVSKICHMSSS